MDEFKEKLYFAICHYAKRQKTWFKNNKELKDKVIWFYTKDEGFEKDIENKIHNFII
jgi:tRNA A37 N6-isopentenylltransferase MiaA